MRHLWNWLGIFIIGAGISACTPLVPETPVIPITVQFTFATQPWLPAIQDCAGGEILAFEQRAIDFQVLEETDLLLHLGDGSDAENTFQVGVEEIVVIAHPDNPLVSLTTAQVQEIFRGSAANWSRVGGEDLGIQVWVFPAGEELQRIFQEVGLTGAPISTYARLVSSPEAMLEAVAADQGAVGLLTRTLVTEAVKVLYSVNEVPVLAVLQEGAAGNITEIITCLQK